MNATIPLRDPVVRDLYWTLSSAPLLRRTDAGIRWPQPAWFHDISLAYRDQLTELDTHPQPLHVVVRAEKDRRLGNYFETLWRFWLASNDRYRLLYANLPVRSADRTLGEFDLLVEDSETGRTLHWELAVKFYLGIGDTTRPENWWGPAQRDRLDIKIHRLLHHQSRLSQHPQAAALLHELGIRIDERWVILKGRLFYPLHPAAAPPPGVPGSHKRGFWVEARTFARLEEALWLPLDRRQWLAPLSHIQRADCLEGSALLALWRQQPLRRPLCMVRVANGSEIERGFVVPDDWLARTDQSA